MVDGVEALPILITARHLQHDVILWLMICMSARDVCSMSNGSETEAG